MRIASCIPVLFVVILSACATLPCDYTAAVFENTLDCAGLPPTADGFSAKEFQLQPDRRSMTFQYLGAQPGAGFSVTCFAESPAEQHPDELTSLASLSELLFQLKKECTAEGEAVFFKETDTPAQAEFFSFTEAGKRRHGALCIWRRRKEPGAWVYVLNLTFAESADREAFRALLGRFPPYSDR